MAAEVNKSEIKAEVQTQEASQTNLDNELKMRHDSSAEGNDINENNHDNNNNDGQAHDDGDDDEAMDNGDTDKHDDSTGNNNESIDEGEKTNLIVNYLPQQMTDEQFENLFKKYGPMRSCKIVRNKNTGYSYGFGFADYETHEQALKAIDDLNGHEVDTKKIKVAFARPAGQDIKQANLYVKGIPNEWTQDDVKKIFDSFGQIIQVRVLGNDRGIAFVLFDLRKQAQEAMEAINGTTPEGCEGPLEIKFAADKKSEKRGNRGGQNQSGRRERGGRRRGGRSLSNNRNNNNNNDANNSNQRRGTSQQGRGHGGRDRFNKPSSNNSNNFNNNHMNGGGVGPVRQQQQVNRMSRYAPFAPMQQPPMQPTAAPGIMPNPYGYAAQPMMQYMMPNQIMGMQMGQQQQHQMQAMAGHAMNPYAQMGYAQPPAMAQPTAAMSNMYNLASSTLNNAAQMQPQLGQPMNLRGPPGLLSSTSGGIGSQSGSGQQGSGSSGSGGGGGGGDGITLFVYNIGQTADEAELKSMFTPYGDVIRSNVVRKTPGGETKGFGFVTVRSRDQANAAIAALNGQMRNGKTLQVSFKK